MMKIRRKTGLIFMIMLLSLSGTAAATSATSSSFGVTNFTSGSSATASIKLVLNPGESSTAACGFSQQLVDEATYPRAVYPFTNNRYTITTERVEGTTTDAEGQTSTTVSYLPTTQLPDEDGTSSMSQPLWIYWHVLSTQTVEVNLTLGGAFVGTRHGTVVPVTVSFTNLSGSAVSLEGTAKDSPVTENVETHQISDTEPIIKDFHSIQLFLNIGYPEGIDDFYYLPEDIYTSTLTLEVKTV